MDDFGANVHMMCAWISNALVDFVLAAGQYVVWVSRWSATNFPNQTGVQIGINALAIGAPLLVLDAFVFPVQKRHTMYIVVDADLSVFANVTDVSKFISNQLTSAFGDYANDTAANTALALWMKQEAQTLDHIERGDNDVLKRVYVVKKLPTNTALAFDVVEEVNDFAVKGTLYEIAREFRYKFPNATAAPEWRQEAVHVLKRSSS